MVTEKEKLCQRCQENEADGEIRLMLSPTQGTSIFVCRDCANNFQPEDFIGDIIKELSEQGFGGFPSPEQLEEAIKASFGGGTTDTDIEEEEKGKMDTKTSTKTKKRKSLLDSITTDLTEKAANGEFTIIGRDKEIEETIIALNRLNKNNPVLIGEAGVGKTAVAEAIAVKIAEGDVPSQLLDKKILALDVSSLVAGTGIRGQFESKMEAIMKEVEERGNVILFIDEMHLIVGAGGGEGALDASNILKPALSRGRIQIMGATTTKEYRKIEKDAALERRFQPIKIDEPKDSETLEILKGVIGLYQKHHNVSYGEDVLNAAITLSKKYIHDRKNPDKALDLIDFAGSKVSSLNGFKESNKIRKELNEIIASKENAILSEDFIAAADIRVNELQTLGKLNEQLEKEKESTSVVAITTEMIKEVIQQKTGIPVAKMEADQKTKIKTLDENLKASVIGQDKAVDAVVKATKRSYAGMKDANRPIGSFLFVGPTGVGKTELTKQLAIELFGEKDAMVRLDMSEFMEKHTVSKLIGAPPGYIGHEEAGGLTEKVRIKPHSLILLDELEKAHPEVQNVFLQILEDGVLTDSHGKKVSFKDTIIIATSNAGTSVKKTNKLGFGSSTEEETQTELIDGLKPYFRPEFINRFDGIIKFEALNKEDLVKIVDIILSSTEEKLSSKGITLKVTADAKKKLAELGYQPEFGARPLRRVIQDKVEDQITDLILDHDEISEIKVGISKGEISVEKVK